MTRVAWNHKRKQQIQDWLRTVDVCVTGHWFCVACQQISQPETSDRQFCAICGSARLRYHPPIMSEEEARRVEDLRFEISKPAGRSEIRGPESEMRDPKAETFGHHPSSLGFGGRVRMAA